MAAMTRGTAAPSGKKVKGKTSKKSSPPTPPPSPYQPTAHTQEESDDDAPPEVVTSKVLNIEDHQHQPLPTKSKKANSKKRPRKMKAREERYFAGKEAGGGEGGEEGEEQEEGEVEGEGALTTTTTTSTKKIKTAAAPLSMEFLETVQQAKAADQQRRIHEALQIINLARQQAEAQERKEKAEQKRKLKKTPKVFGNIRVTTLDALSQQQEEEGGDVPAEVLAFARTQGESSTGTRRKRVSYVAFAKAKPAERAGGVRGRRR